MSDLIDRQAAIEALKRAEAITRAFGYHNVIDTIRDLPTVTERKGKWEHAVMDCSRWSKPTITYCSVCEHVSVAKYNYCPNCGTKMEVNTEE